MSLSDGTNPRETIYLCMWTEIVKYGLVAIYVSVLALVALYGFHRYVLVYLYIKHRDHIYQPKGKFATLPRITVQLPMYNEDQVAERVIRHTAPDRLSAGSIGDSGSG